MKINTPKIQKEMKRLKITLTQLGQQFNPPKSKQSTWYVIHCAKNVELINKIADALELDPKDLLL